MIGLAVALIVAWLVAPVMTVEARDDRGTLIGSCTVAAGGRVAVEYRHSMYGRPGREEFSVSAAGLGLVRLWSPSEAVLEYYGREERVRRVTGGFAIDVADPPVPSLGLRVSALGRRTLVCADERLPLFERVPSGARVLLTAGRRYRVARPRSPAPAASAGLPHTAHVAERGGANSRLP